MASIIILYQPMKPKQTQAPLMPVCWLRCLGNILWSRNSAAPSSAVHSCTCGMIRGVFIRSVTVAIPVWSMCRSKLSEAEEQGGALVEQQEGAEELVRALRQELHNLRQDTNSVAANARQTVSEKEALQVSCTRAFCLVRLHMHHSDSSSSLRDAHVYPGPEHG